MTVISVSHGLMNRLAIGVMLCKASWGDIFCFGGIASQAESEIVGMCD